jgi:hypothetical protein
MTGQFAYVGETFVNFSNGTFQWVHAKRFALPTIPVDDRSLLALLIAHDLYGDNYAGGTPGDDPTRHGPYWRDRITVAAFDLTQAAIEETHLRAWAEQHTTPDDYLRAELEHELFVSIRRASALYRLHDLGKGAFHDWGWVLGPFHELILIDRSGSTLTLVVACDD